MAKNYTMGQAARIFAENKVEEMADIMRRFPYASMMLMKLNVFSVLRHFPNLRPFVSLISFVVRPSAS